MSEIDRDRIRPFDGNRAYWQYRGKPVMLLGASVEDNLFQIPDLEEHLDLLASVGGNYVRSTLSSRDPGNVWPFERDASSGLYDLSRPGTEYWQRFERFLDLAEQRGIILQIELWDRFDFARGPWQDNPFNPRNTDAYTADESGLPETIDTHPGKRENPFFRSVPALDNNELLLKYQHVHIERLLSLTLPRSNVLYCMDNETNESAEWGAYWAQHLKARAAEAGHGIELTEMWDAHDLRSEQHEQTWKHPERYTFVDISQNNHNAHQVHWDNIQWMRDAIAGSGTPRPLNTVKIYGANTGHFGNNREAQERFWRNIFGGIAATRFHRPPAGLGLGPLPQRHIRAARMLLDRIDLFSCEPSNDLLRQRSPNEAYCTAHPGREYAVFFPDGGDIHIDVSAARPARFSLWWLDILAGRWSPMELVPGEATLIRLRTPREDGYWCALVKPEGETATSAR